MKILGIDPGYAIVGYGVVEYQGGKFKPLSYGVVTTKAGLPMTERLKQVYDGLCEVIETHKPDCMAVEELFFNTNVTTAIAVGHARGVILLSAANNGVPVFEYTPLQVKQAVVGYGRAEKKQVQEMVRMMLGLQKSPKPDDAADALALCICHGHSHRVIRVIGGA